MTWDDLDWVRETSGLPVVVKGVSTAEDARLALDHGAEADRRLEPRRTPARRLRATAVALREVVDEVHRAVPVLVDGGIRSGC
jgi:4-hydroxymandelate oxidase